MIRQYLSNTNERATVSILQNILELNKALLPLERGVTANLERKIFFQEPPIK